jgi:FkbM family methyltransferase
LLPLFVRRLSYSPKVRGVIRALGLQKKAQSLYYRLARKGDSIQISAGGVAGSFFSANARDLRIVEACAQERALARLLSEVRPEDVVYDVGAHHGLYAILLAQRVKRVIAFEPEQESYARLERNIQINGLSNITSFCMAIGDRDAQEILYLGNGVGAIDSGQLGPEWTMGARQTINVVRGDTFRQSRNLPVPTVLKIDVEGYEGAVLEGLRQSLSLPECRLVCCEIHPALLPHPGTKESLVLTLKSFGFSDVQLLPHKTEFHAFAYKGARQNG